MKIQVLTSAPKSYDGFSTKTLIENYGKLINKDLNIRLVEMEVKDYNWQVTRYTSGMNFHALLEESEEWEGILFEKVFDKPQKL